MKINIQLSVNRAIQILLLFLFIVNVSQGLFFPLLAVFITGSVIGATLKTVGFAAAAYAIAKSLVQIPLARIIDNQKGERDDFYVMIVGALIGIIYTFGYLFISLPWHLYLLSVIGGIGGACLMAAYYGIFARHVDKGSEGFEWSLFSVGGLTLSIALGGAAGGIFADIFGFPLLFITAGILNILATIILLFLYPHLDGFRRKVTPPQAQATQTLMR